MATAHPKSLANDRKATREIVSDSLAIGVMFALGLTVFQRLVGFGRNILFCRLMTPEQLGQWSMVFSFLMLLAPLAVVGLPGSFGRYVEHYRLKGQLGTVIGRSTKISIALTLGLSLTMVLFPVFFSRLMFRDPNQILLVYVMGGSLVFVTMMNYLVSLVEALRQVRLVTLMRFISSVVFALVACILLLRLENAAAAATIGFGASCLLASVPAFWFLWRYRESIRDTGQPLTHRAMWSRIAPFALWLWMVNLVANLFEFSDRYMLIQWSSVPADIAHGFVGQYHSGRAIPLLMVGVAAMLEGVLMPYLSAAWEDGREDDARRQLKWTIKSVSLFFTLGGVCVLVLAPLLFNVVLQGRYDGGLAVMPLTLVYCIWLSLLTLAQAYIWLIERGRLAFVATIVGLVLNVVLNMALIPVWELWGAVIATAIATGFTMVLIYGMIHRLGCRADFGIWLTAALPGVLLLPLVWQIPVLVLLGGVAVRTHYLFSPEEKSALTELASHGFRKIRKRFGSSL